MTLNLNLVKYFGPHIIYIWTYFVKIVNEGL